MKFAWCSVVATFAAFYGFVALIKPSGDGDLWWQRVLGEAVVTTHRIPRSLGADALAAAGAPWVPQEWMFGIFAFLGRAQPGSMIFAAAVAFCGVAALALTVVRALRRGATPSIAASVALLTGLALFESFGVRAQVVAWPLFAGFLLLLECEGAASWLAIPLTILWANVHASAMLAFVLAVTNALGHALDERGWTSAVRRSALIALGTFGALFCNPFGWDLPRYALMLFGSPIRNYIDEWRITDVSDLSFYLAALPLLGAAVAFGIGTARNRWRDRLLFTATAYLLLTAARNIPIFVLAVAPIVAQSIALQLKERTPTNRRPFVEHRIDRLFGSALAIASLAVSVTLVHIAEREPPPKSTLPLSAVAATERLRGSHRIFCASFEWCSLFRDRVNNRVFLDGRADPFPPAVWAEYGSIRTLAPDWQGTLARRGVDTIISKEDSPLGQALAVLPNWRSVYHDATYRVYVLKNARASTAFGLRLRRPPSLLSAPTRSPTAVSATPRTPALISLANIENRDR